MKPVNKNRSKRLKRYYDILGVRENASKAEIKRSYRKLVMRYHPDRNPDPKAAEVFAKIQEAYEIVYNRDPHTSQRARTQHSNNGSQQARERRRQDDARAAQKRKAQHVYKQHLLDELFYRKLTTGWRWLYFRIGAITGLVVACLMILEYTLPSHYETDHFKAYSKEPFNGFRGGRVHLIQLEDQGKFWVEGGTAYFMSRYPDCFVERSWLFHSPKNIVHPIDNGFQNYPIEFSMRAFFPFSLIVFCFPFLVMYKRKKNTAFSILYHFSFYLLIPLCLIFLLTNDRWAHVLTLGFV